MEYLVMLAAVAAFLAFVFISEGVRAKKKRAFFVQSLYEDYGKPSKKEYAVERYARIGGYYEKHRGQTQVDDITWNDLNMDAVFQRMDYTFSATGEEYLYYTLRNTGKSSEELAHFEELVEWFRAHADERVQVQLLMNELGHTGKFSLYDYIGYLDYLGERSNLRHYCLNALFVPLIILAPFQLPVAILGIVALSIYQIVTYFKDKGQIEPYIISFSYVVRLLEVCRRLGQLTIPVFAREQEQIRQSIKQLHGVEGGSFWVFNAGGSKTSGNPLDMIMDYVRMVLHVDLIVFNKMLAQLRNHLDAIDELITQAGLLETVISVGAFRNSLANGWCVPKLWERDEDKESGEHKGSDEDDENKENDRWILAEEIYHPLLDAPVKNNLSADRGILLTGSNASGKSTFLKTIALNAILAQTIHTCTADSYSAPFFRVYSSMALRDDMESGESYYIVEIKSLKRILDAAGQCEGRSERLAEPQSERFVLCFVDEVLRGTNTVERIAASTQILKSLAGAEIVCFAATHDIELTELLDGEYDNYHFEEEVKDGDIYFPYKLLKGKATTRNAIRLLEIMGYDASIIGQAEQMAGHFVETGVWQA